MSLHKPRTIFILLVHRNLNNSVVNVQVIFNLEHTCSFKIQRIYKVYCTHIKLFCALCFKHASNFTNSWFVEYCFVATIYMHAFAIHVCHKLYPSNYQAQSLFFIALSSTNKLETISDDKLR